MADFDEMAMLFAIDNVYEYEFAISVRQIRKKETISDPFDISDRPFIKNFRLTKDLVKYLVELLEPYIDSKSRQSAIDLNTKVSE